MIVDLLERLDAAEDSVALVGERRSWTYGDLRAAVDRRAASLSREGVAPGRIVPVVLEARAEDIVSLLGYWRLGATPAPLHPALTPLERAAAGRAAAEWASSAAPARAQAVLWTSGTAGRARGVAIPFAALLANAQASAERLGLDPSDVWLASLSPAHVGGLALVTRALLLGSRIVAVGPCNTDRTASLLNDVTHTSLVPMQLARLLDARSDAPPPPTLRCALVGGAAAPTDLLRRALRSGWPLALTYGLTEATSQVATAPPELTRRKPGTVGKPLAGVELRVDEAGEVLVRGSTLAASYVGTEDALTDADGWHRTGDLGRLDDEGDLWVTGRRVDRIVTGGVTVDAREVEEALRSHPSVVDAGVVGVPDPEWGERVSAWIVWAGGEPDLAGLDAYLSERVSGPKRPRVYHVGPELPRNPNGKLNRAAIRAALERAGGGRETAADR